MMDDKISEILMYHKEKRKRGWQLGACKCGQAYAFRKEKDYRDAEASENYEICPVCNGEVSLPSADTLVLWAENTQLTAPDRKAVARIMKIGEAVLALEEQLYYITCEGQVSFVRRDDAIVLQYVARPTAESYLQIQDWIRQRYEARFGDWLTPFEFVRMAHRHLANIFSSLDYWTEKQLVLGTADKKKGK